MHGLSSQKHILLGILKDCNLIDKTSLYVILSQSIKKMQKVYTKNEGGILNDFIFALLIELLANEQINEAEYKSLKKQTEDLCE